uniref:carbonic anhydrase n=1 Tax=Zooxanthella nutricula TaxID=1333877 RepID=A0A7S2L7I4_9DINO
MVLEARGGGCNRVGLESDNHTWYASFAMAGCTNLTATWHGRKYTLQQIHFHIESENMLHGHHMDMEVHMVHKSADNRSLVIGLFVQRSHIVVEENRFLDRLLELHYSSDAITSGVLENPYLGTMKTGDRFYSFLGSLTTPPCTPNLEWVLIQDILYVAPRDIQKFEHFLKTRPQADSYGHDDRPVQPLNFRPIKIGKVSAIM